MDSLPCPLLLTARDEPPWLPPGSRAEVWAASLPPSPTGLVRLVLRYGDEVFCVARDDGRADLPTRAAPVHDPDGSTTARELARDVLGDGNKLAMPCGFVRNVVPDPPADYPWPTPEAHFTLWSANGEPAIDGSWLSLGPRSPLRERHWFPLIGEIAADHS